MYLQSEGSQSVCIQAGAYVDDELAGHQDDKVHLDDLRADRSACGVPMNRALFFVT